MSLDLSIPADVGALRELADWLEALAGDLEANDGELTTNFYATEYAWKGESANAFRAALMALMDATSPVPTFARDLAEVVDAYCGQIERGRERFDSYRRQAFNRGLISVPPYILPPQTSLRRCPAEGADPADIAEWERYVRALEDYNTVGEAVGEWWAELELWIAENFGALAARIAELGRVARYYDTLASGEELVIEVAFEGAEYRAERDWAHYRDAAQQAQDDYDLFKRDLRSGHPGIKAGAEKVDFGELKGVIKELNVAVDTASRYTRVIPVVGGVIDVVAAGVEIADGGSTSSVLAGLGGGGLAGWLATGAVAGPVGVIVVGAAVVVGGGVATWAWEAAVPLEARDAVDAWFEDGGDDILFTEEAWGLPATPQPDNGGIVYPGQEGVA